VNFRESETYLLSLGNEVSAMKLGLESIRTVLGKLGGPERKYLKVQVAGTNGKGSVCAFLDAICRSASVRTGLYTSPHLVSLTERIKVGGTDISEKDFARHATRIREICESLVAEGRLETVPTFFEQVTAIALTAFAENAVELAILETGLGGRLDATTAARAEIAAITQIAHDHQNILGESLAEIAAEKAAIIHRDSKVVVAEQYPEAMNVILRFCREAGITPKMADEIGVEERGKTSAGGCAGRALSVTFVTRKARYENVYLSLLGRHQIANARVAVLLAETLQQHFAVSEENIIRGLETAVHPGRLEFRGRYLFDGAHNTAGARALSQFLEDSVGRPITMIFGAMRDKNIEEIADVLFPKADNLILTRPDNSRALSAAELAAFVPPEFPSDLVHLTNSVAEALATAESATEPSGIICITGSLYLVGEAQQILKRRSQI
jgi:dihydrofolate synthase/folylpolyglutamate synthase